MEREPAHRTYRLMELSGRDGLGWAVAIYMAAMMGTLGALAVPVYYAVSPQVYENPPPEPLDPLLNGPIVGKRVSTPVPLALLKHPELVDPKLVAELNAKMNGKSKPARHEVAQQPARRERAAAVAELPDRPERSGFFLFNLFGG
ncbi:MAG: hypothetical protein KIT48_19600 [Pseudolabrys sp.]|nr:hypothetical protein [Pseudolabrys sp.]